jgi:eukaryotic-like serine/threonine-protein kinase
VLRARDAKLGRTVAVKELAARGPGAAERFFTEARLTARLQHPSIVPVHDLGRRPDGTPYYTMTEITGPSLEEVIGKTPALEGRLALLPAVLAVGEAVAYAHSEGVVHRDLKPANVVVGSFGETVVIDWGLAKEVGDAAGDGVIGTPAYMAPEQARGKPLDERVDVYALGALLYQLLAGVPPYQGSSSVEILAHVQEGPPVPLARRQPGVPRELESIVGKAMARDPQERYRTARELAADLKRFLGGRLVSSHRYSAAELARRWVARHRAPVAVAAASLAVLVTLGILGVRKLDQQRREAEGRRDDLVLLQARGALDRDPTEALGWLKEYEGGDLAASRTIALEAVRRGTAQLVLSGHERFVRAVDFTPDGKRLISSGADGLVVSWDLTRGQGETWRGHVGETNCIAISPDGALVATGGDDTTVRLWSGGKARVLEGHRASVIGVVFLPGGTRLVSAAYDRTLRVWDVATGAGRVVATQPEGDDLNDLAVSSDGRTAYTVGRVGHVYVVDLETGVGRKLLGAEAGGVWKLALSPDGKRLATASNDRVVRLWDLAGGPPLVLGGHQGRVKTVAFSPDGTRLASGADDNDIRLWDLTGGAEPRILRGHRGFVMAVQFSPDGATLASGSSDRRVRVWTVPPFEARVVHPFEGSGPAVFSPSGKLSAFADGAGKIALVDHTTGPRALEGPPAGMLRFSPDEARLGLVTLDGSAAVIDLATGLVRTPPGTLPPAARLYFAPDSRRVVLDTRDHALRLWDVEAGSVVSLPAEELTTVHVTFTADGRLVAGIAGSNAVLWDGAGAPAILPHAGWLAESAAFSPDGTLLATGANDHTAALWDVAARTRRVLAGHDGPVARVAFSPDGRTLATTSDDQTARLWDIATGASRVLVGHENRVTQAVFSPDGHTLATASVDRTLRLWDTETGATEILRGHTGGIDSLAFAGARELLSASIEDHSVRIWRVGPVTRLPEDRAGLRRWLDERTRINLDAANQPVTARR